MMKAAFARIAVPMAALLASVGLTGDKARQMPRWDRERIERGIRRQAQPVYSRYRDTKKPYALARRRAKNKIARATRKAQWRAMKAAA